MEDPLEPARAVVVLGGKASFRVMEAAKLYNQGWAHEVWLTRTTLFSEDSGLAQPGIDRTPEHVYSRMVLRSEIRILRNRGGAIGETPLRCSSNVRCRPPRHVKNAIQNEAGPCAVAAVRHPPQPGTLRILPFGPAGQEATFHLGHVKLVASGARTAAGNLAIMSKRPRGSGICRRFELASPDRPWRDASSAASSESR